MRASHPASCCSWLSHMAGLWEGPPQKAFAPSSPIPLQDISFPVAFLAEHLRHIPGPALDCCWSLQSPGVSYTLQQPQQHPSAVGVLQLPAKAAAPRGDAPWLGLNHSHLLEQSCIVAGVSAGRTVSKTGPIPVPPRLGTAGAGFGAKPAPGSLQTSTTAICRTAPWRQAFIFVQP